MKKVKAGLIGAGGYGAMYVGLLSTYHESGQLEFAAAVVRRPEKIPDAVARMKNLGVRIYPDSAAMYQSEHLDLVCIPTGIEFHEPMTLEALEHGVNVLVEKPVAGSMRAVEVMKAAEKTHPDNFVMVGFQHVAARELQRIKQILVSGRLGKVEQITAFGIWPRADVYYGRNDWAGKLKSKNGDWVLDSPANNAFAHYLNISLFLAGRSFGQSADAMAMEAELYRARPAIETFDSCAIRVETAAGVKILALFCHSAAKAVEPMIRIDCENGSVHWAQGPEGAWEIRDRAGKVLESGIVVDCRADMMLDAAAKVADRSRFVCTLEIGSKQTSCIEKLHQNFEPVALDTPWVARRESDGQLTVTGMEALWTKCFNEGKMPSECGDEKWLIPSKRVEM
ncbi:MAG: Gfo/Idh/MocA family protein [Victivallaceae bacterium]